eukprot:16441518-Heterocapsa_arctica.AAC.1
MSEARANPGCHLHGSLLCTPWTAWQRMNLRKASEQTKNRILRSRVLSMDFIVTFIRLAKA